MYAVSAKNIEKSYGGVKALRGIGFEVPRGEMFGIIGPDGAGKSTLFRILTTLLLADSGEASVEGLDVVRDYGEIRRRVGYMPGRFSLYQDMSVEENLNFYATLFGTTVRENYDLVKDIYVQLEPFRRRRAGALSGGMKQKLALCCALIHKPDVLFLDEPTTGVDPVSRREFWEMLGRLRRQGITILVSTPYMDEASLCDRIALINEGRFMKVDSPEKIMADYSEILWAVRASARMPELLQVLRRIPQVRSSFAFGDLHHITVTEGFTQGELKELLAAGGFPDSEVRSIKPGIEDCYMLLATPSR